LPVSALIFAIAPHLVPVLFGSKWLDAVPLMQMLALAGGLIALHSPLCALLIAHGHPDRVALSHVVYVAVLFVGLFTMLPKLGIQGAALAVLCAALISTPAYLLQVRQRVGVRIVPILRAVLRPAASSMVMVLVVQAVIPSPDASPTFASSVLPLFFGSALAVVVYVITVAALWILSGKPNGAERFVVEHVRHLIDTRRRAAS
jgi:O-antigen/teichoic acid export membrane protein